MLTDFVVEQFLYKAERRPIRIDYSDKWDIIITAKNKNRDKTKENNNG